MSSSSELPSNCGVVQILSKPTISKNSRALRPVYETDVVHEKPQRKRTTTRNGGKLKRLLDLPVEVVFMVASQLHPLDLLQLSRISKHFHHTFAAKSSRALWEAARKNVPEDLPDPPSALSEPKYVSVLFERHCFACGVGRSSNVDYALMVRLCAACWKANTSKGSTLMRLHKTQTRDESFVKILTPVAAYDSTYHGIPSDNVIKQKYYIPEFEAVLQRFLQVGGKGVVELQNFVAQRQELVTAMLEHAQVVEQWHIRYHSLKNSQETCAQKNREESIKKNLYEMGFTEDDFPSTWDPEWFRLVSQPRDLTPRIWKQIKPKLVAAIGAEKKRRIAEARLKRLGQRRDELRELYAVFLNQLSALEIAYPSLSELFSHPEVDTILQEDDTEIAMSEDRFKKLVIPHVDAIKKENRAELLERFLSQVTERSSSSHDRTPDDTRIVASDVDPFSRATFLLKCHVSYGCRRHDLYHYSDSGKHLKCLQFSRRSDIDVCSKVAQDVLKLLQLPVDTPYATISRKIVCQCGQPKFVQPASFTDLVTHIIAENDWFNTITGSRRRNGSSAPIYNDHDLHGGKLFLRLCLDKNTNLGQTSDTNVDEEAPKLDLGIDENVNVRCKICCTLRGGDMLSYYFGDDSMSLKIFIHHVRSKHRRDPTADDILRL